jgi:hypothetical protein
VSPLCKRHSQIPAHVSPVLGACKKIPASHVRPSQSCSTHAPMCLWFLGLHATIRWQLHTLFYVFTHLGTARQTCHGRHRADAPPTWSIAGSPVASGVVQGALCGDVALTPPAGRPVTYSPHSARRTGVTSRFQSRSPVNNVPIDNVAEQLLYQTQCVAKNAMQFTFRGEPQRPAIPEQCLTSQHI